jgi:hypothetical protein
MSPLLFWSGQSFDEEGLQVEGSQSALSPIEYFGPNQY